MVRHLTITEPVAKLSQIIGEGCVWDTRTQRLIWSDIDRLQLWTYEPSTGRCGFEQFDLKISCIALTASGTGYMVSTVTGFNYIPASDLPFPPTHPPEDCAKSLPGTRVQSLDCGVTLSSIEKRVNDGACDNRGRFLAGTMGKEYKSKVGKVYSVSQGEDGKYNSKVVVDGITCTNGMGWTKDGKTLYLTDSWVPEIAVFDYDEPSGTVSNRRTFSKLPEDIYGEPDGLCMDADDGVWSARFMCGKVVRIDSKGELDVVIDFPTAWHMTCCVFGGPELEDLYVVTAESTRALAPGMGREERTDGGSLFVVKGLGFKGVERSRFADR